MDRAARPSLCYAEVMNKRLLLLKGLNYTLIGVQLLGMTINAVRTVEEAQRIVKAKRKRRPGFR